MGLSLSRTTHCRTPDDNEECTTCGWKCRCIYCESDRYPDEYVDCHCTCRFWIVVCSIVCIGFCLLFASALFHRRTVLSFLSSGAVFYSGTLLALTVIADHCVWPAFFSITMVFAFPCFYSCCWSQQSQTSNDPQVRSAAEPTSSTNAVSRPTNKPTSSVIMLFPDGDMQLGVKEIEMHSLSEDDPTTSTVPSDEARTSEDRTQMERETV